MATKDEDKVDAESVAYKRMARKWGMLEDLIEGTQGMRDREQLWLPAEPKEDTQQYRIRLDRSFLYNAFGDTVKRITSKPFVKPVTVGEQIGAPLDEIEIDVDETGQNLTQFARKQFETAVIYGLSHILVDFVSTDREGERLTGEENLQEERQAGARPLFVHVTPPQLLGWRLDDAGELDQIRIAEVKTEPIGLFGDQEVKHVRVYDKTSWQLWRQGTDKDGEEYVLIEQDVHTFGAVPLLTWYTNRAGFMEASPPLEDLGWQNLAHWQSYSDFRNILRFASLGILFGSGFTEEEIEKGIIIGPNKLNASNNENAKLGYVEHTGKALTAGEGHLERIEERMEVLGLQPMVRKTGSQTATGKAIDEARVHSDVQAWIRSEEGVLKEAYEFAGRWIGQELQDDFKVEIFSDIGLSIKAKDDLEALIKVRAMGDISHETFLREIQRRALLSESIDVEEESQQAEDETPMAMVVEEPAEGEDGEEENAGRERRSDDSLQTVPG